jgi:hypothetical protein
MRRKGYDFRLAPHLTFRTSEPEKDTDAHGDPLRAHMAVPVRLKDCEVMVDGHLHIAPRQARCLPNLTFTRTNMAYGPWRHRSRGKFAWRRLESLSAANQAYYREQAQEDPSIIQRGYVWTYCDEYWTRPVYWIEDGRVYRATAYSYTDPDAKEDAA